MKRIVNQVAAVVSLRLAGVLFTFVSVPLLISILGSSTYGSWVALASLVSWLAIFDLGLGYSLKNKIAASTDTSDATILVVGVLQWFMIVSLAILVFYTFAGHYVGIISNHPFEAGVLYLSVILTFPLTISNSILQGLRKTGASSVASFLQQLSWFLIVCIMYLNFDTVSLTQIASLYAANYVIFICFQFWQATRYFHVAPSLLTKANSLIAAIPTIKIGMKFFVLQVGSLLAYSLGTFYTYTYLSADSAGIYDTTFKLFQLLLTLYSMVITVAWPEITKAHSLGEYTKLARIFHWLLIASVVFSALSFLVALFASQLVALWTANKIIVPPLLPWAFATLISVQAIAYSVTVFLNATNKVRGQVYVGIFSVICMIPMISYFYKMGLGFISVPVASILITLPGVIFFYGQTKKIISAAQIQQ